MHKMNKSHFLLDLSAKNGHVLADGFNGFHEFKLFNLRILVSYTFSSGHEKDQAIQVH